MVYLKGIAIEESKTNQIMMPTLEQMLACVRVCQSLSNFYTDINLFRYDEKLEEIYILAGETIGITILKTGRWEFDDDTEV